MATLLSTHNPLGGNVIVLYIFCEDYFSQCPSIVYLSTSLSDRHSVEKIYRAEDV